MGGLIVDDPALWANLLEKKNQIYSTVISIAPLLVKFLLPAPYSDPPPLHYYFSKSQAHFHKKVQNRRSSRVIFRKLSSFSLNSIKNAWENYLKSQILGSFLISCANLQSLPSQCSESLFVSFMDYTERLFQPISILLHLTKLRPPPPLN